MVENGRAGTPSNDRFLAVGEDVFFSPGGDDSNGQDPTVILIFGWMSAQLPHLHKYTEIYSKLYPNAAQILVRCRPSVFWKTQRTRESLLAPVVDILLALGCIPLPSKASTDALTTQQRTPRILIHSFSNGGSFQLITFSKMLFKRQAVSWPRFTTAIILDSSPGGAQFSLAIRTFTSHIRNPIFRAGFIVFITLMFLYDRFVNWLFRTPTWLADVKASLLDPCIVPWVDAATPRLYIFSKTDALVPWRQVLQHANEAAARGLNVRRELFDASPHVAHARTDPARYWSAVTELWKTAMSAERSER